MAVLEKVRDRETVAQTAEAAGDSIAFAIVGSGGAGALTAGAILLEAAGKAGWYGLMTRSVGPQIRGGEAAALISLANRPVDCPAEEYDFLVAIDWRNVDRFAKEMPLAENALAIGDPAAGEVPAIIVNTGATLAQTELKELAGAIPGGRENMIAAGIAAGLAGLPIEIVMAVIASKLESKGQGAIDASRRCLEVGMQQARAYGKSYQLRAPSTNGNGRWLITGNEAVGLGAVRGGVRFAAAYPITPATEVLEWLSPSLRKIGGALLQAEDELASINMAIGASFGGRASITATSGPGLSLMVEALGLAIASEVPIVVVDVMRGGPSTGIPTKSEQSDLNIAVYGCHGDAPHIVVAPLSVRDCLFSAQWAVYLAEAMQTAAIILSDQSIGQARALIDSPIDNGFIAERKTVKSVSEEGYNRYAFTDDNISPMAVPGLPGGQYTADGLTHSIRGLPSTKGEDHQKQLDKRRDKVEKFDYGEHWAAIEHNVRDKSPPEFNLLTWGSLAGPAREAMRLLSNEGISVKLIAMRLIAPLRKQELLTELGETARTLIVEQTHSGQFHQYLRAKCDLPGEIRHFHRPGPQPIGPKEICDQIRDWKSS